MPTTNAPKAVATVLHRLTGLEQLSDPTALANAEVETQVHAVRWFQIADALETLASEGSGQRAAGNNPLA